MSHEHDGHEHDGHEHGEAAHELGDGHGHSHAHTETKAVLNRLSRAIGHLTAVRAMVEKGRDCPDVLVQLAAVRSALNGVCEVIIKDHIDHCIADAIKTGDTNAIEAINHAIAALLKR